MLTMDQTQHLLSGGGHVVDTEGNKIGKVGQIFLDDQSGQPEWVTVKTGLFGGAESFVPLASAHLVGEDVAVPFDKEKVKGAPRVEDSDGHLDESEEAELFRYYGLAGDAAPAHDTHQRDTHQQGTDEGAGHDTSGPDTDSAMTRSEEQLHVGTERVATGRARLRKYVVTENVTKTVPVSHEEVRIEREPITDANRDSAMGGADITTEEHEVELSEERAVAHKETVPVERVKMGTETVTDSEQVTEQVRKEEIDVDSPHDTARDDDTDHKR